MIQAPIGYTCLKEYSKSKYLQSGKWTGCHLKGKAPDKNNQSQDSTT